MSKLFCSIAILLSMCVQLTSIAQDTTQHGTSPKGNRMREVLKPELIQKAAITDEQAEKVLDIFQTSLKKMKQQRVDTLKEPFQTTALQAIFTERTQQIKAIPLTAPQTKAAEELLETIKSIKAKGTRKIARPKSNPPTENKIVE